MSSATTILRLFQACALALLPGLAAATPTATPTPSPGAGSYAYTLYDAAAAPMPTPFLVNGNANNALDLSFTASGSWNGGLLTFRLPAGFSAPGPGNFYVRADQASKVQGYSFGGQQAQVRVSGLNDGETLILRYGWSAGGFSLATTQTSASVAVWAYPQSQTLGAGGLLATPLEIPIYSPTVSPTVTPSFTESPSFTASPSPSDTPTATETPVCSPTPSSTVTPLGPAPASQSAFYCYPNPFDLRKADHLTIRFLPASDPSLKITIFNLLGHPVRELPAADIGTVTDPDGQPQGVATWRGEDDRGLPAAGGLYFVRLKGAAGTRVRKLTVLR